MKEVILLCGAASIFMLCGLILNKILFTGQARDQRLSAESNSPSVSLAFEHIEEVESLSNILGIFSQKCPSCQLNLFYGSAEEIRQQLNAGKLDLGFFRTVPDSKIDSSFDVYYFLLDEHVIACQAAELPIIPLNRKKYTEAVVWKKGNCTPEAILLISLLKKDMLQKEVA